MGAPASIPHVGAILASLVVDSLSNSKFSIISEFCLIVDSHFHSSRALTRSLEALTLLLGHISVITTTATKTQWTVDVWAVVGGDGGPYVVMEHMPKPQQKLRWTLHFSVLVVVGSVFFLISL